jgi:hypothetical protein
MVWPCKKNKNAKKGIVITISRKETYEVTHNKFLLFYTFLKNTTNKTGLGIVL